MLTRRHFIAASVGVGSCLTAPRTPAIAQTITKPSRLIVGFPAGGSIDAVARLLVENMKGYAPSLIVDNRPGAGGRTALDMLKGGEADGSVIGITPGDQLTLFPHVYNRLSYKPGDFTPVTTICSVQFLLTIGPMVPADIRSLADFIAWCRGNPKVALFGTAGAGSRPHFLGTMLARAANFDFAHLPYKGNQQAVQDLLGGHVAANVSTIGNTLPQVQSGALRALATTAPRRSAALPDVPTFGELGYPMLEGVEWFGIVVPSRTPAGVVAGLHEAILGALRNDDFKAGLAKLSFDALQLASEDFAQLMKSDTERWAGIVKAAGFTPVE
jgi:tripartite-type tricarboxylate transporter receptor subunit TctC